MTLLAAAASRAYHRATAGVLARSAARRASPLRRAAAGRNDEFLAGGSAARTLHRYGQPLPTAGASAAAAAVSPTKTHPPLSSVGGVSSTAADDPVPSSPLSSRDASLSAYDLSRPDCNVTPNIASRIGRDLHRLPGHPLHTVKTVIYDYWKSLPQSRFALYDDFSPVVPTVDNFDSLLIPPSHPSRSMSDTYYLDADTVLRTHTSAHQTSLLSRGEDQFLVTGDVYRRDEIDSSHYPVFHQMEGVRMFSDDELAEAGAVTLDDGRALAERDLKQGLEGMARALFGDVEMRWVDEYFPFTDPSFELEIYFRDEWMEVLGCGVVHRDIVRNVGRGTTPGWAFGLGLERLAMVLFSIPDIRLFWSEDERFRSQFKEGDVDVTFQPYSKYPACYKDISFWTAAVSAAGSGQANPPAFHENDFYEIVRDVGGDLVERVELIDDFTHPKTGRTSHCYRVSYRSMDRSLTNEEVDELQEAVRTSAEADLGVELR